MALNSTARICGFHHGDLSEMGNSSGTVSVQSSVARTGTYSFRVNPTTTGTGSGWFGLSNGGGSNLNDTDGLWISFYFRAATLPASAHEMIMDCNGFSVCVTSGGKLQIRDTVGSTQYQSDSSVTLSTNTWYNIQIRADAGVDVAEVWVNGTQEIATTSADFTWTNTDSPNLGKPVNVSSQSVDFYYDDVIFLQSDTRPPDDYAIHYALPDGNGTDTAWVTQNPNTGEALWEDIDDPGPHDGTTTNIASTALNDAFTVTLQNTGSMTPVIGASDTIHAVCVTAYFARNGAPNTSGHGFRMRVTGSPNDIGTFQVAAAFQEQNITWVVNPDDSAAFEPADVDNIQLGAIDKSSSNTIRCTALKMYACVTAAAGGGGDEGGAWYHYHQQMAKASGIGMG